ncbi:threonine/serine ThrE exporter family protein [Nocardioides mesophilus]|uniref:Threonine/serine exporter family protein n=1 Tax=Nocardioides mesophilus TaxID=433659 RepID=A0A7G9R9Z7_9ACTN|nr:threonine/serine exporter family protein [Nocardioides mesophilus]QNN52422.1 threonine/serine exporter family protein [Nocardioides mesophilus]
MPETKRINKTLDLALRVGEVLLSSGAGAADVNATMWSVVHACGLRGVDVDVTFTALTVTHQTVDDEPPRIAVRHVRHREIDYEDLTEVDHLVRDLISGRIDLDEARARLARIVSSGHRRPRWAATLANGVMGAGVGLLLGGNWLLIGIAFVAAVLIDRLMRAMSRRRLPGFYQQVAGGLVATLLAVGTAAAGVSTDPSMVVTASIIMLLAGIGFMGAVQDALTGFPLTAGARILEAMLATAGIIAGVSGGLAIGDMLGVDLGRLDPGASSLTDLGAVVVGSAVAAGAFAYASYAPLRTIAPIALIAGGAALVFTGVEAQGVGRAWAAASAAVLIGVVSYSAAGRVRVPPLVVVVSAIVPLLPGLSIYRGLALLGMGGNGILSLINAVAIAIALASGVLLGEHFAQPLKREARRLEDRLAGPRLVGPLRARTVSRGRRHPGERPEERAEARSGEPAAGSARTG